MDIREIRSFSKSFFDSQAFPYVFGKAFRPLIRRWVARLLTDKNMGEAERTGIITALEELYAGFVEAYGNCELPTPEWLDQEFFRGLISE